MQTLTTAVGDEKLVQMELRGYGFKTTHQLMKEFA